MSDEEEVAPQDESDEQSIRGDIERAIEEVDDGTPATPGEPEGEADSGGQDSETEEGAGEGEASEPQEPQLEAVDPAPAGWTPEVRELWEELPDSVKQEVAKRESEISLAMQNSADARKGYDRFQELVNPYQAVIAAEGAADPYAAVEALMKTASTLRLGTDQQKAARIAGLIEAYGVDINSLDEVLSKSINPQQAQSPGFDEQRMANLIDQKLQPVNQHLATFRQQEQQTIATELDQFTASHEFVPDVRNDMADILDMASKRGEQMSLEQAYNKACRINDGVNTVIESRVKQSALDVHQQGVSNKLNAASSVSGRQTNTAVAQTEPTDLRGALERAIGIHSQSPARI